jgi:hypothetical protein
MRSPDQPLRKRRPAPSRRRAPLELLAASPGGCTVAIMRAHGFTIGQIVALARAGLARARLGRVVSDTAVEFVINP